MKIIKRSQLAMLSVALMIMIAGYINYKYDPEREKNLGQTMRVNSGDVYLYETSKNTVDIYKEIYEENKEVLSNKDENIYNTKTNEMNNKSKIEEFKTSRDNMLSELEETYRTLSQSTAVNSEDVTMYKEKLDDVIKKKHLINIVEGIIKAKGITDIVIVPTEDKYNVMIEIDEKLTPAQVAMIEKIIEEEFKVDAKNINIIE